MSNIDDDLRRASAAVIELIATCEARPGSTYAQEMADPGHPPSDDDKSWSDLYQHLHYDLCLRVGAMSNMLDATSDLLRGAEVRSGGGEIAANRFGINLVARSLVEALAINRYLLEGSIDAAARMARYLTWRFEQMRSDRNLLESIGLDEGEQDQVRSEERSLVEQARLCGFDAREGDWRRGGPNACLLDGGKPVRLPTTTSLVELLMPNRLSLYRLLSFGPHGSRSGTHSTISDQRADGKYMYIDMAAPGLDVQAGVVTAVWALWMAGRDLGGWCGSDLEGFDSAYATFFTDEPDPKA